MKNTLDVIGHLIKLVTDVKAAIKAGGGLSEAIAIANAVMADLMPLLSEAPAAVGEVVSSPLDAVVTVTGGVVSLVKAIEA